MPPEAVAVVAIGRDEGDRLRRCLAAATGRGVPVVYVDSGSQDGSASLARSMGIEVVELDPAAPFTAGRARNEGFVRALALHPSLFAVQFVDGDCELFPGWLDRGLAELRADASVAASCGRVRERNREATIYNRLCDMEWDAPPGESRTCGGNAMMRVAAFEEVGGFRPGFIAGEEPELCLRLRGRGWRIVRVAEDMVLHDAAMTRFSQWWRRAVRAGWAYAAGAMAHGAGPERHNVKELRSIAFWGAALPVAALGLARASAGGSLLLLAGYLVLAARVFAAGRRRGWRGRDSLLLAGFTTLAKFPQAFGALEFALERALGRRRGAMDWRRP